MRLEYCRIEYGELPKNLDIYTAQVQDRDALPDILRERFAHHYGEIYIDVFRYGSQGDFLWSMVDTSYWDNPTNGYHWKIRPEYLKIIGRVHEFDYSNEEEV